MSNDLAKFREEQRAALLSMDRRMIEAYARKWGVTLPEDEEIFWIGVHEARTACMGLPLAERYVSRDWLTTRGYQHFMAR